MRLVDADEIIKKANMQPLAPYILKRDVDNAPTIDAEPVRHGQWIKMTGMMPPEFHGHYECSECGWHLGGVRQTKNREEEFAYCPYCGAEMLECNADGNK